MSQPSNGSLTKHREPLNLSFSSSPTSSSSTSSSNSGQHLFSDEGSYGFSSRPRTNFNLDLLMQEIAGRVAVIDACLPPQLADDLRERGISAVWVPAIMGDGASDEEIDRQLLISDWQLSYFKNRPRVLLTKDVEFYRKIRNRAILVRKHHLAPESRFNPRLTKSDLRKLSGSGDNE